ESAIRRRVESIEFRIAPQQPQVGIALRPISVAKAGGTRLPQDVQGFCFSFQQTIGASSIVKHGGVVWPKANREIQFAQRVVNAIDTRMINRQHYARAYVLRYFSQMRFESLHSP